MTYLPDVNVWIALASSRHVHHNVAEGWLDGIGSQQIAFCRITELGFLRLLTNGYVMGKDVLDNAGALHLYDQLSEDRQVVFLSEAPAFKEHWRTTAMEIEGGPHAWTDGYIASFAAHADSTVVTFDKGFRKIADCRVLTLSA